MYVRYRYWYSKHVYRESTSDPLRFSKKFFKQFSDIQLSGVAKNNWYFFLSPLNPFLLFLPSAILCRFGCSFDLLTQGFVILPQRPFRNLPISYRGGTGCRLIVRARGGTDASTLLHSGQFVGCRARVGIAILFSYSFEIDL